MFYMLQVCLCGSVLRAFVLFDNMGKPSSVYGCVAVAVAVPVPVCESVCAGPLAECAPRASSAWISIAALT